MTQKRIVQLAHEAALARWTEARQKLDERPKSLIAQQRETDAWNEYFDIHQKLEAIVAAENSEHES